MKQGVETVTRKRMMLSPLIEFIANLYIFLIIIRTVLSWFNVDPYHPAYRSLIAMTEPVLGPIRKIIPISGIDFSPFIAIILIQMIVRILL